MGRKPKLTDGADCRAMPWVNELSLRRRRQEAQVKSVEETYGIDNLHLTVAKGYVRKLLGNSRILRWLSQHRREYLTEFQSVAEIDSLFPARSAAE
ncbi:MAG: hypothetical protein J0H94_10230 [Rhizobiales bacterium]|nr:hypothetical protein [Hyphomicrobiales bacterium]MBN8999947.1 hypothetical protein [Hyphomicrobiales bacterium]